MQPVGQGREFRRAEHARKREEIAEQMENLEAVGLARESVFAVAREHDVHTDDVFRFHSFLEALHRQLPGSIRRRIKKRTKQA